MTDRNELTKQIAEAMWRAFRCNPNDPAWDELPIPERFPLLARIAVEAMT